MYRFYSQIPQRKHTTRCPIADLEYNRRHRNDLRVRTLTSILAALKDETPTELTTFRTYHGGFGENHVITKILDQLALLLVQDHEVVALVAKHHRSAVEVVVDGGLRAETEWLWNASREAYVISDSQRGAGGPEPTIRFHPQPSSTIREFWSALLGANDMLAFSKALCMQWDVNFADHSQTVVKLINQIDGTAAGGAWRLSTYSIFRSSSKILRRFRQPIIESICAVDIAEFQLRARKTDNSVVRGLELCPLERSLLKDLLLMDTRHERLCPTLWIAVKEGRSLVTNSEAFAGEYHLLLLSLLQQSKALIQQLVRIKQRKNPPFLEGGSEERVAEMADYLQAAQRAIILLLDVVERSQVLAQHMVLLEYCGILGEPADITLEPKRHQVGAPGLDLNLDIDSVDLVDDERPTAPDDSVEIAGECGEGEPTSLRSLRLLVSYQQAVVSCFSMAAKTPRIPEIVLHILVSPVSRNETQMMPWEEEVMAAFTACPGTGIRGDDAVQYLQEWAAKKPDNIKQNHIFLGSTYFTGTYHAESVLATLANQQTEPISEIHQELYPPSNVKTACTQPHHISIAPEVFTRIHRCVGVSKRCCPVCTKILMFLGCGEPGRLGSLGFSGSHHNIYACALPPMFPIKAGVELVEWLQSLVRQVVGPKVVEWAKERGDTARLVGHPSSGDSASGPPGWDCRNTRL